jgi:hypothetical protein
MGTSVEDATSETHETRRGPAGFSRARMRGAGDSVRRGGGGGAGGGGGGGAPPPPPQCNGLHYRLNK